MQAAQFLGSAASSLGSGTMLRKKQQEIKESDKKEGKNHICDAILRAKMVSAPLADAWSELHIGIKAALSVFFLFLLALPGLLMLMILPWFLAIAAVVYSAVFGRAALISHVREATAMNTPPVVMEKFDSLPGRAKELRASLSQASKLVVVYTANLVASLIALIMRGLDKTINVSLINCCAHYV